MSASTDESATPVADCPDADSSCSGSVDADRSDSPFPTPPRTVTDAEGRAIRFRPAGGSADERDALAAMYDAFGAPDRAQGIPPANPDPRARWLDCLREGIEVVAWHGDTVVGHGILLDGGPGHELALFVHPDYRGAGVGTALLRTLLGRGQSVGVERVWLSVERTNRPAVSLYRGVGFEATGSGLGELEMALSLG